MKTAVPESQTMPPKRLLYKGFTYVLAARSDEGATIAQIVPAVEQLLVAVKAISEDERTLTSNKQTIARLWGELNEYFKLLIPR